MTVEKGTWGNLVICYTCDKSVGASCQQTCVSCLRHVCLCLCGSSFVNPQNRTFVKLRASSNLMIAKLCVTPFYPQTYHSSLSVKSLQPSANINHHKLVTNLVFCPESLQSPALMFFSVRLVRC